MIQSLFETLRSSPILEIFGLALFLVFITGLFSHHLPKSRRAVSVARGAPTTLITLGVLGTFVGIAIGLLEFDVNNIDRSIPSLLDGLKVAFLTSILGMIFSVFLRMYYSVVHVAGEQVGAITDDIARVLTEIRDDVRGGEGRRAEFENQLIGLISGESDSTLITQLQKLRTTLSDGIDEFRKESAKHLTDLSQSFEAFAQKMAENNSKALIDALNEVLRDFNTKINEQFGENFKQLNEAVGQLLVWQRQNQDQMKLMSEQFQRSLEGIEKARVSLVQISTSLEPIPGAVDGLGTIISTMAAQTADLQRNLTAFSQLAQQAQSAFPEIEGRLNQLTTGFSQAVMDNSTEIQKTVQDSKRAFETTIKSTQESLTKQVQVLDTQMQEELKRAIEAMGSHLASLSGKFVEDYGPLADRLREVVQIARRADAI